MADRDLKLDSIKGFTILLVVLGHSIQSNVINFDNNGVFKIIYSFHMPLFMFLSGYVAAKKKEIKLDLIKAKAITLLLPFVTWYLLGYILNTNINFKNYLIRVVKSPDYGLWFLWVLFICFFILIISDRLSVLFGIYSYAIICICLYLIQYLFDIRILGSGLVVWQFPFFIIGYLINRYKDYLVRYKAAIYVLAAIFVCLVPFWRRVDEPLFLQPLRRILNLNGTKFSFLMVLGYKYIVAFAGIATVFLIIGVIYRFRRIKYLEWLGQRTLDIYAIHFWLLYGIGTGSIKIITTFLFAITVSIVVSCCLREIPIISFLLLGKDKNFKKLFNKQLKVNSVNYYK